MKKLSYILLLAAFICGLNSTAQDIDPNSLSGTWHSKSKKNFIEFKDAQFQHNFGGDTITGVWSLNGSELILVQNLKVMHNLDSTVLVRDNQGSKLLYFSDGAHVATEIGDSIIQEIGVQNVSMKKSKTGLSIKGNGINAIVYQPTDIVPDEGMSFNIVSVLRGLLGMAFLVLIAWLFSANRKAINWNLVGKGIALQFIIAFMVLKVPFVETGFNWISGKFVELIAYTDAGVEFLFANMGTGVMESALGNFAFKVLPTIIFFSALVSLFYYWGILQKVVYAFAWIMKRFMKLKSFSTSPRMLANS